MKFKVMSRENARKHSFCEDIDKCVIVSINGTEEELNQFNANPAIHDVCYLVFDDVETNRANCMSRSDADKILAFVDKNLNQVDEIIIHCGAGISRSAGVCAALMLILNGNDSKIFNNPYFRPNMHCYRLVLNEYFTNIEKYEEGLQKGKRNYERNRET